MLILVSTFSFEELSVFLKVLVLNHLPYMVSLFGNVEMNVGGVFLYLLVLLDDALFLHLKVFFFVPFEFDELDQIAVQVRPEEQRPRNAHLVLCVAHPMQRG